MEGMLNYFVPEDGDSSEHLNVVPLPRVESLCLQHIKESFPLLGDFHFRFKTAFEGTYVWLDIVNDADPIPDFNGLVIAKISRIQRESPPSSIYCHNAHKTNIEATDLIETAEPPSSPIKREEPQLPQKVFNNDLVGLMADPVPSSTPSVATPVIPQQNNITSSQAAPDPFDVFGGSNTAPMKPTPISANISATNGPRGLSPTTMGPHVRAFGAQGGFHPMASGNPSPMAPRVPSGMNISQMHMGIIQPPVGMQQQQKPNSFQGLQWQGMGQQQQQQRNPNQRW